MTTDMKDALHALRKGAPDKRDPDAAKPRI
jgi:hypothetical protein